MTRFLAGLLLAASVACAQGGFLGGGTGSGGGGGGVCNGSGIQGNIYDFGFENQTLGNFTDPDAAYTFTSATAACGTWSAVASDTNSNPANCNQNLGHPLDYHFAATQTKVYARFAYRQSSPFNNSGGSNACFLKMLRFYQAGFSGAALVTLDIAAGGADYIIFFDTYDSQDDWFANCNAGSAPHPNSVLGAWHIFEVYLDVSNDATHVIAKVWIDGTLYHNHDAAFNDSGCGPGGANTNFTAGSGFTVGEAQFDGTINGILGQPTQWWFDQIGLSTTQMGVPPHSFP